jgi:preprotein translocase subunit SecA
LRGRSGRQGDPGSTRFYLSLEDDLMRIFGSDRISGLMGKLGMEEDVPIENRMVSKAIENAQKRVEEQNFDIRKHLLEYDDVMNKQRTEIYAFRKEILQGHDLKDRVLGMMDETIDEIVDVYCPEDKEWDLKGLKDGLYGAFSYTADKVPDKVDALRETLSAGIKAMYETKESEIGSDMMRYLEKVLVLQVVDSQWKDHLLAMDHLKEGIGLRGYGQRDPLVEYKKEGFDMFAELSGRMSAEIVSRLFKIQIQRSPEAEVRSHSRKMNLSYNRGEGGAVTQPVTKGKKTGRNDPCPCGSGKKYKKCCGVND